MPLPIYIFSCLSQLLFGAGVTNIVKSMIKCCFLQLFVGVSFQHLSVVVTSVE